MKYSAVAVGLTTRGFDYCLGDLACLDVRINVLKKVNKFLYHNSKLSTLQVALIEKFIKFEYKRRTKSEKELILVSSHDGMRRSGLLSGKNKNRDHIRSNNKRR